MIAEKPESNRQIGYIERLRAENRGNISSIDTGNTSLETQKSIFKLVTKQNTEINELWLSLAVKECFRHWTGLGRDVYGVHREPFVERAIETYRLFAAVAERLNTKG